MSDIKMNELEIKENVNIENMIYEIRGKQVMLDSDLAKLFGYETFNLNKAVKRNAEKFGKEYMFILSEEEYKLLIFQNGMSKNIRGGRRTIPFAFTEKGILMLATILKSKVAIEMSIKIIDVFVNMRKYFLNNIIERNYYNKMIIRHDTQIKLLQKSLDKLSSKEKNNHIFYGGQIYDAYSLMLDIFKGSKENIIIIDNYVDKNILDILSKTNKKVLLITNKYNNQDYEKYKKQYNNVTIKINNAFHDRFIIIDRKEIYHCGSSFKDLGKKCFAISKIEDSKYLKEILKYIL